MPAMPAFDFSAEWGRFKSNIPEPWKLANDGREFQVGEEMKSRGLEAKFPVVLIPGIISTGLESWSTTPEFRGFFRQKVWGGFSMVSQVTFNKERWMAGLMLDPVTGLDPPGVKVRAAEGLNAASSFIQGYWLWSKVIENLAMVNYDTNNLYLAPYDWRLSFWNLEERDGYFSKLKSTIEGFKKRQKKKTVIAAHSMGATVCHGIIGAFLPFKWVESPEHGGGGPNWVEEHIESFISIAGTHLAKAMAAFLSGEMKDTVQMNPAGAYVLERFFSRKERARLFRSWVGSASMWVKGGDTIWGNSTHAPDDVDGADHSHGELIAFRAKLNDTTVKNMTADNAGTWILEHTPTTFQKMLATNFSCGIEKDERKLKANDRDHTKWTNPLESRLPDAPSMKFFCVYGHGKDTEASRLTRKAEHTLADAELPTRAEDSNCETTRSPLDVSLHKPSCIDNEYTDQTRNPKVLNGVKMGEGDGTVSLLSLGAMCVEGWKRKRWNPAGIKITTVELPHRPVGTIPRGGGYTADHVDILGSTPLSEVILKVATGAADEVQENFTSDIRRYAERIQWD
ncbi:phospholipid diacylglycerol acyltransferase [Thelephora ganbajun]|uniref:Phospholipid diacylglycerol acyltransferase n=1 Tax=Thelephora ganbajun TaxID=370292 RepID=A0ACB6ZLZ4_THEGA|nr:phospholipid diacylglycerol acyltransferase [Thelephora ganbajun]